MRLLGVVIANGLSPESRVFANLLSERRDGYDAMVMHHDPPQPHNNDEGAVEGFEAIAKVPLFRCDMGWRRNVGGRSTPEKLGSWLWLHRQLPRMLLAARRFRPDVVYSSQQIWDCYAASALSAALGVPQAIHLHYTVGPWLGRIPLLRLRRATAVVCVSQFIRGHAHAHGVSEERLAVVPNTLRPAALSPDVRNSTRQVLGIADGAPLFVFAARLAPGKGHADVLNAFRSALVRVPSARLIIAGDGELRTELLELARRLSLDDRVSFLGHRRDVPALLAAGDVFVHPSLNEPFGLAILEASAQGLPTIAYRDSGPAEIVRDGESGLLVEPRDVERLSQAMVRLGTDRALTARMGEMARSDLEQRFSPALHAARFADFLGGRLASVAKARV